MASEWHTAKTLCRRNGMESAATVRRAVQGACVSPYRAAIRAALDETARNPIRSTLAAIKAELRFRRRTPARAERNLTSKGLVIFRKTPFRRDL